MRTLLATAICALILGAQTAHGAEEPRLLNACESAKGLAITWGGTLADTRVEAVDTAPYATQGKAAIRVCSVVTPGAKRNEYAAFRLPIPPADMKGKTLLFDAATATPDTAKGFYVRGFNKAGKHVLSWYSWSGVLTDKPRTFALTPRAESSGLEWEKAKIEEPGDTVVALDFIVGSGAKGKPYDLYIDNVRLASSQIAAANAKPRTICDAETLQGVSIGLNPPDTVLELNADAAYVSQGKKSLHLAGKRPVGAKGSTYLAIDIALEGLDMRGLALAFDAWTDTPEATQALYVRGYDATGKCVASWASWKVAWKGKTSFELIPKLSLGQLAWEAEEIKSPDLSRIAKLRFYIGSRKDGADFGIYLDNIRTLAAQTQSFGDIDKAAPLFPDTALMEAGKPAALIVVPEGPAWQEVAEELNLALADAGATALPVRQADEVADSELAETNAVLIGSVVNNRRLLYPYSHLQVFADDYYPGPEGYDLRSVSDPWGTGKNILSIGASDAAGARAAIAALKKKWRSRDNVLIVPRILEVHLTGEAARWQRYFDTPPDENYLADQKKAAQSGLERGVHTGLFGQARNVGRLYCLSRHTAYARAFVWLIQRAKQHHDSDPDTYGGPWGMDSDFTIYGVLPAWDEIEECTELTDRERLEVSRILFEWVADVGVRKGSAHGRRVRFNHQTFPALGITYAGHYFSRRYKSAEAKRWLDIAKTTFDLQIETYKPHCDCNTYQWLTLYHTILYSLATQNLKYFETGQARRNVDYVIHTMNNLGYQVAYGDIGGWGPIGTEYYILQAAEWFYRDGRARWAIEKKSAESNRLNLTQFTTRQASPARPDDLLGASIWPLAQLWYDTFLTKSGIEYPKTFDKIVFRDGFEPDDTYLLLDGLSVGGHRHMDGNAILGWSQHGRIWLADGDYIKALPKFHNGVLILRNGQSQQIPDACELVSFSDMPALAVSRTAMRNYAGVDWTRNLLWLKGQGFVVLDRMQAIEQGDYSFRALWQTVGDVELRHATLDIEQKGRFARFVMTPDTPAMLHHDPALGKNWSSYPYGHEPVIRVMQGIAAARLEPGQTTDLFTALHSSGDKPSQAALVRVAPNAAVLTGAGDPGLVYAPSPGGDAGIPGLVSGEAALFVVRPKSFHAIGARRFDFLGISRNFDQPTDVEIDLESMTLSTRPTAQTADAQAEPAASEKLAAAAEPREAILALLDKAAPPAAPSRAGPQAPAVEPLWKYASIPDRFLISNNAGAYGAVDTGARYACSPEPLSANVFSQQEGANTLDRAFDGQELGTSGAVMWDDDQEVTVDLSFSDPSHVASILIKAWFATSSSKNTLYQLGRIRILASNDGFQNDSREIADFKDSEMHPSWGTPIDYPFKDLDIEARDLRFIFTPRPGTAVYISEIEVWGKPPNLSVETAGPEMLDKFSCLATGDLDGDGVEEIVAGAESGNVYCLSADGQLRWRVPTSGAIHAIATVDYQGDGKRWVVAGGAAAKAIAIDGQGKIQWTYPMPTYKRAGYIHVAFAADLDGQGRQTAILGADNWRFFAIDAQGKKRWHYESVHPSTAGAAVDIDDDNRQEVALGTAYYWWHLVAPDGSKKWGYRTRGGPGVTAIASGNTTGDARPEIFFGGEDSLVQAVDAQGEGIWQFNTGDEVTALQCVNLDTDGPAKILVSSLSFNAYCLDGQGRVVWRTDLGSPVRSAVCMPSPAKPVFALGCDNGNVYLLDPADGGRTLGRTPTGGRVVDIEAVPGAGRPFFVTAGDNGYLMAIPSQ